MAALLRAELRKVSSTKLWWGLLIPVAFISIMINLFGGLFSLGLAAPGDDQRLPLLLASLAYALALTAVFAAVHGIVAAAGEFRHRTITTTYLTAPGRGPVLLAKMAVGAGVGLLYALVTAFFGTLAGLAGQGSARFPEVGALLAVTGTGLVVCALWSALGVALGTVISNQVTVLVTALVYVLIGENVLSLLLNNADSETVARLTSYLPVNAGDVALYDIPADVLAGPSLARGIVEGLAGVTAPPAWWASLLVLAAWTAAVAATGWVVGGRRDIT
jgi:ABC-2 type transport system permease protein